MSVTLIDARSDSLTVSWPAAEQENVKYRLEYKSGDDDFALLSDKLSQPQARKRNLTPGAEYFFRVQVVDGGDEWLTHDEAFTCLTIDQESMSLEAPKVGHPGLNQTLHVSWSKSSAEADTQYELQMRENQGGTEWKTIAPSLSGTEVKKKNLTSKLGYQFRVRPNIENAPFSPPSDAVVAKGLSVGLQRFFSSTKSLLRSGQSEAVPLADALGGKEFVLLYASAHWCPPCRQFTPMLANWYKSAQNRNAAGGKPVEIVFLSCDHDEDGFASYFKSSHPWMAVDYEDDAREQLLAAIRVQGIPRLVVLSAKTGRILVDNAVGQQLDVNHWRRLDQAASK
jgi:thiol-disulfide isomerase/thioredoxin